MSKMSELEITIGEMLDSGRTPESISHALEIPIAWVYEVMVYSLTSEDTYNPYDTVNS
jgi:hypothetical protein